LAGSSGLSVSRLVTFVEFGGFIELVEFIVFIGIVWYIELVRFSGWRSRPGRARSFSMAKSPEDMAAAMVQNLKANTGKTLDQWLKVVQKTKLAKHGEIVKALKGEHGVTHGYANMIAHSFLNLGSPAAGGDDLIAKQYAGAKADLKPVYDKLVKAIQKFGKDVEISPKKAYVSLRRSKQFAIIQPSTKTRVDVGINLKGVPPTDRLEKSGSFNAMVSHRVRLENVKQVDKELLGWLKDAFTAA
jgi:uncharacterized protein DUF5655/uncharacterized protein DUF4287